MNGNKIRLNIEKKGKFTGSTDSIYGLAPGFSDHKFYSASGNGWVVQWDIKQPEQGVLLMQLPTSVFALHYLIEQNLLIVAQNNVGLLVVNPEEKDIVHKVPIGQYSFYAMAHYQNKLYLSGSKGVIWVIDTQTWKVDIHKQFSQKSCRTLAINKWNHELIVGYSDCKIRILSLSDLKLVKEFDAHENSVFGLVLNPSEDILYSVGRDARLKAWGIKDQFSNINTVIAHMYAINHIIYLPQNDLLVTCSMDKTIKIWDANSLQLLKVIDHGRFDSHTSSVNKIINLSEPGSFLACSDDRTITCWNVHRL